MTSPEPQSRNTKARVAKIIIAGATALALAGIGGATALLLPNTPEGEFAELPTEYMYDSLPAADTGLGSLAWAWEAGISEAMQAGDKEAFLAYSSGAAKEKMSRWWDSTKAIGWDVGFATAGIGENDQHVLTLGVQLAFSSHPIRGSGSPDSGLMLTQNFPYSLTVEGDDDDLTITDWEPLFPMPWDFGDIYVAKRDHVVLYGLANEAALVDANIDLAEQSAELTLSTLANIGGTSPVDGFVAVITDDEQGFNTWLGKDELDWTMDVAGFARSTQRPDYPSDTIPAGVATGSTSSGSLVAMGPSSADQRQSTFVHEFAHVLHEAAVPYDYWGYQEPAPAEGFARYFENAAGVGRDYFEFQEVGQAIAANGEYAMSEEALRNQDAWIAYAAAGSFYQYVADSGGSAWQLALDRDNGFSMSQRARLQSTDFSEAGWQAWAAGH